MFKGKIAKCKKGQIENLFFVAIEVFLASAVMLFLLSQIGAVKDDTAFHKEFLAKDLALLNNAVGASQGNVYYAYEPYQDLGIYLSRFSYELDDNKIKVKENNIFSSYPYQKNFLIYTEENEAKNPDKIFFERTKDMFTFGEDVKIGIDRYNAKNKLSGADVKEGVLKRDEKNLIDYGDVGYVSGIKVNPLDNKEFIEGETIFAFQPEDHIIEGFDNFSIMSAMSIMSGYDNSIVIGIVRGKGGKIVCYVPKSAYDDLEEFFKLLADNVVDGVEISQDVIRMVPIESDIDKNLLLIDVGREMSGEDVLRIASITVDTVSQAIDMQESGLDHS